MTFNKAIASFAPLALAAALAWAPTSSNAGLVIQITDGTQVLNIADGSALDGIAETGGVSYSGAFGGWTVAAGYGSRSDNPLAMHLSALVMGDRSDGKVWIKFTTTDLVASSTPMSVAAWGGGSSSNLGTQAAWTGYVDDSNTAFGTGNMVHGNTGFATGSGSQTVALHDTYSATLVTSFDYRAIGDARTYGSSLDVSMAVPEPSGLALFGLGLLGLGVVRLRKPRRA